jgi:UDP-3-O-[3-hydroxymyristoyl] glucosamine N-acyltransferase
MPTLKELCRAAEGDLRGEPGLMITGVASLANATERDIAPVESVRWLEVARTSKAGALLAHRDLATEIDRPAILSRFPLAALNRVIEALGLVPPPLPPGIHPTAIVDPEAVLGKDVHVGAYAVIGRARIGARCILRTRVVIEDDVEIGEECLVEPGAVLHPGCRLGKRVRVGANAVLGREGFGYAPGAGGPVRLHHVGRVVLGDDAHVGACVTIDRARYDETRVGRQSALDNLVHLGHNCIIGDRTFVAAQTGLAGGARIGNDCEIGGQVGLSNQGRVGDRCRVGAQSGVIGEWGDGVVLWGCPALPKSEFLRGVAVLRRLARGEERASTGEEDRA